MLHHQIRMAVRQIQIIDAAQVGMVELGQDSALGQQRLGFAGVRAMGQLDDHITAERGVNGAETLRPDRRRPAAPRRDRDRWQRAAGAVRARFAPTPVGRRRSRVPARQSRRRRQPAKARDFVLHLPDAILTIGTVGVVRGLTASSTVSPVDRGSSALSLGHAGRFIVERLQIFVALVANSRENSRRVRIHRVVRNLQLGSDLGGRSAAQHVQLEAGPRLWIRAVANPLERELDHPPMVLDKPLFLAVGGQVRVGQLFTGGIFGLALSMFPAPPIFHRAARHLIKPRAKPPASRIVLEVGQGAGQTNEDFLDNIACVGLRHAHAAGVVCEQRFIQRKEFSPTVVVDGIADPNEKRGAGCDHKG